MPTVIPIAANFISGIGFSVGSALGIGGFLGAELALSLTTSLLLSAASNALLARKAPSATEIARELGNPSNSPPYRFVYGETRAAGSPAGIPIRGEYIYGCWIVNSRESEGPFDIFLDKREAFSTGDPYDFSGVGATATTAPFLDHFTYWISKGEQTTPPTVFTTEAGFVAGGEDEELWKTTDGWQGLTVIWCKIRAGGNGERQERWPSAPPNVEVQGKFSKVWDMRDLTQDPNDRSTWKYNNNWSLCIADALRTNPVKVYQNKSLDLQIIEDSANVSDEIQTLKSGGSEKRYTLAGTLAFTSAEIEDLISPMVLSGGGALTRIGGKLGVLAASYQEPVVTISQIYGDSFSAADMISGEELSNELRVTYLSETRGYEAASLEPYNIPNALAEDGGVVDVQNLDLTFCPSPTQAMRVRKIFGGLIRRQKNLNVVLPPEAFTCVVGSTLSLALDAPFNLFDGVYEVRSLNTGFDIVGDNGLSMLLPATLTKHSSTIYDWDPDVDEEDIVQVIYSGDRDGVSPSGTISAELEYFNSGGTFLPRVKFLFDPSPSINVEYYEWDYAKDGGSYTTGGNIDGGIRDGTDVTKVSGFLLAEENSSYDIRVRTVTTVGKSGYVTITGIQTDMTITSITTSGGVGEYTVAGTTPTSPNYSYIKVFSNTVTDFSTSVEEETISGISANTAFSSTYTKAVSNDYYWMVPYSTNNTAGTVSGPYQLEIT